MMVKVWDPSIDSEASVDWEKCDDPAGWTCSGLAEKIAIKWLAKKRNCV